jgi:cytidine deaminase
MNVLKIEIAIHTADYDELSVMQRELIDSSKAAVSLSHAPYSKFHVGCAIRLDNNRIVQGANQENAAYPICLCAEGATLASVATQFPNNTIIDVAIYVPQDQPASPCGLCRQSFKEYETRMRTRYNYILASDQTIYLFTGIDSILPLAFSPEDLTQL